MARTRDYHTEFAIKSGYKHVAEAVVELGVKNFKKGVHDYRINVQKAKELKTYHSIKIELKDNRWLVNNKHLQDCSDWEREFMNQFFKEIKNKQWITQ